MPIDKATIETRLTPDSGLWPDPPAFIDAHSLPVRAAKPTSGQNWDGRPTRTVVLHYLAFRGIKIKIKQVGSDPVAYVTIDFNPGVCLFGHNGCILAPEEFLDALGLLHSALTPLLASPDDAVDIVPGLRVGGPAYWSYLEIPFQCSDPEGTILKAFRQLRHPSVRSRSRHWPDSILVGRSRSNLCFSIYRKAVEMVKRGRLLRSRLQFHEDALRLEARLKDNKLIKYLGNDRNVEIIDGNERIVRFFPCDLVRGHRTVFSELQGVYGDRVSRSEKQCSVRAAALGSLIARAATDSRTARTLPELLSSVSKYCGTSDQFYMLRKAAYEEMARASVISFEELFSDAAYDAQYQVGSPEKEEMIYHDTDDTTPGKLITAAYRPEGQPFRPQTQMITYHHYCPPRSENEK